MFIRFPSASLSVSQPFTLGFYKQQIPRPGKDQTTDTYLDPVSEQGGMIQIQITRKDI